MSAAFIRKLSNGHFRVYDRKGRGQGLHIRRGQAEDQLLQIERTAIQNATREQNIALQLRGIARQLKLIGENDLCGRVLCVLGEEEEPEKADLSYSYVMRELRQTDDPERLHKFMVVFKKAFDAAFVKDIDEPANVALMQAMKAVGFEDDDRED
jgi:hypothetical protein